MKRQRDWAQWFEKDGCSMNFDLIPLPARLQGDSGWLGALHVLNCPLLRAKGISQFVDLEKGSIYFRKLLRVSRPWSSGERLMVQIAASLFSYEFKCPSLWDVVNRLDQENVAVVAEAIRVSARLGDCRHGNSDI